MTSIDRCREDFAILADKVHGKPLCYLDSAATALKPRQVLDAIDEYYQHDSANVHRGVHTLSQRASERYENVRTKVAQFIGAPSSDEIVFTSGTTASINLVARSYGDTFLNSGDEIIISEMEHHANIVPWQMLSERKAIKLQVVRITDKGDLDLEHLVELLCEKTKFVSFVHTSNSLGTINPVADIIKIVRQKSPAKILIDAAQAVTHQSVNVSELDCDFLAFSAHKLFGPTGCGVLWGKKQILDSMPPLFGGGDMIRKVSFEKTTYAPTPLKFEAGTPHIAGVIGMGAGIDYIESLGLANIHKYESELLAYAQEKLAAVDGLKIIGQAREKIALVSFTLDFAHPHDVGSILDEQGIAVRTGHHCCQPLMQRYGVVSTTRASFSFYNTKEDVDRLVAGIESVRDVFG